MGITIHYCGTMDDLNRVEELEDRVLDLVFALGGRATLWRSFADHDASRVVRGLMVDMEPGQETCSLLISPEGHLTPLFQIQEAEQTAFSEPPDCFIKTQFGSIIGHVALVHLLEALRERYVSNLTVSDEGEYADTRDFQRLKGNWELLGGAIRSMADQLRQYGLSDEAMEDADIVALRIERIASLVQAKMRGEAVADSANPMTATDEDPWNEPLLEEEVEWMDRQRRKNDLRSERMARRIAEATASGMSAGEAFDLAMTEEGLSMPSIEHDPGVAEDFEGDIQDNIESNAASEISTQPTHPYDQALETERGGHHPAVVLAESFLSSVMNLQKQSPTESGFANTLRRGAFDLVGGLVQATSDNLDDRIHRALAITQLKRALSGHAHARGAIFGLSSEKAITKEMVTNFCEQLESLLNVIQELMAEAWDEPNW